MTIKNILKLKKNSYIKKLFLPILIFSITLLTHAINLFHFPGFLGDEGIYTSQGWWLIKFGQLSPYTYWYDHAPLGWLQIGLWQFLTGGPFTFGFSLYSTRIFIIIVAALSNILIFLITQKTTRNKYLALLSSAIFAFSPLAVTYHRLVLLDNLTVFWFLLSFYFLLIAKKRLFFFALAGIFFGFSVLSKEVAIFLFPSLLFITFFQAKGKTRPFLIVAFLVSAFFIIGLYPLLAYLKLELLPASWLPGQRQHVSLLEAVLFQGKRKGNITPVIKDWLNTDKILPVLGIWSTFVLLLSIKDPISLSLFLANFFFALFLLRGGMVLNFYLIPQIALWALSFPIALKSIFQKLKTSPSRPVLKYTLIFLSLFLLSSNPKVYIFDDNHNQMAGIKYIRENVPSNSVLIVDPFCWLDLKIDKRYRTFPKVEWLSKIESDPQIRQGKLGDRWQAIDFIYSTQGVKDEMAKNQYVFVQKALDHSQLVAAFDQKEGSKSHLYQIPEKEKLSPLGKLMENDSQKLTLEEKIRVLIVSPKENFGGYLLNKPEQLQNLPQDKPVFIDQEGGKVNRLLESPAPSQKEIKDKNEAFLVAKSRGRMLKSAGVDINLAPVLDIAYQPQSFIARDNRSFGKDQERIISLGKAMIKGFHEAGIKAVIKHFPGSLGRTATDPHFYLPIINIPPQELEKDLAPFAALTSDADGILVTHLFYPQIDPHLPASLSPIFINAILRQRLGFQGPVILDDINMKALSQNYSQEEIIRLGLIAGADMFIIQQPKENLVKNIVQMVEENKISAGSIDRAWQRSQLLTR